MITKENILVRKALLLKELEQAKTQMNALVGALQDCEYWLAQVDKEEAQPNPEA